MEKYLIEIPHGNKKIECQRAVTVLLSSGSHLLTNADFGCLDGEHKAWFFMEADSKAEVLRIVPPAYRHDAKIFKLNKFKLKDFDDIMDHHGV